MVRLDDNKKNSFFLQTFPIVITLILCHYRFCFSDSLFQLSPPSIHCSFLRKIFHRTIMHISQLHNTLFSHKNFRSLTHSLFLQQQTKVPHVLLNNNQKHPSCSYRISIILSSAATIDSYATFTLWYVYTNVVPFKFFVPLLEDVYAYRYHLPFSHTKRYDAIIASYWVKWKNRNLPRRVLNSPKYSKFMALFLARASNSNPFNRLNQPSFCRSLTITYQFLYPLRLLCQSHTTFPRCHTTGLTNSTATTVVSIRFLPTTTSSHHAWLTPSLEHKSFFAKSLLLDPRRQPKLFDPSCCISWPPFPALHTQLFFPATYWQTFVTLPYIPKNKSADLISFYFILPDHHLTTLSSFHFFLFIVPDQTIEENNRIKPCDILLTPSICTLSS